MNPTQLVALMASSGSVSMTIGNQAMMLPTISFLILLESTIEQIILVVIRFVLQMEQVCL